MIKLIGLGGDFRSCDMSAPIPLEKRDGGEGGGLVKGEVKEKWEKEQE